MNTIRKNITLPADAYESISNYDRKCGMSFSEFLRVSALKEVVKGENRSLLDYLSERCSYVDDCEQKEIEAMNINFEDTDGKELTLDELLQG